MFRVYDKKLKQWMQKGVYLASDALYVEKRSLFGTRLQRVQTDERYICHFYIYMLDNYGTRIYEGDYLKAKVSEGKTVIGLVAYAEEIGVYVILSVDSDEYYILSNEISNRIEVIGNVFDGYNEEEKDGKQPL